MIKKICMRMVPTLLRLNRKKWESLRVVIGKYNKNSLKWTPTYTKNTVYTLFFCKYNNNKLFSLFFYFIRICRIELE